MRRGARLLLVATVLLALPACSTLRLGRPIGVEERGRAAQIQTILADRAPEIDPRSRLAIADVLMSAEQERGLDALLALAVMEQESGFRPDAVSPQGALGLMQINAFVGRSVAEELGISWKDRRTLFDPVTNVRIGVSYLVEMLGRFGKRELALTAYNMGPNRLDDLLASGQKPQYSFSKSVLARRARLQRIQADPVVVAGF
ncbi:MAG TPA: transglycosylase SLT domain-containing protein [Myxococcota bacterium]|nr:transglycosylase SLT domain-containing protein [Myxococcota bacterium]